MREEISVKELRHRAEVPMLLLCTVLTMTAVLVIIFNYGAIPEEYSAPVMIGLISPILAILYLFRYTYWKHISGGAEITDKQYADVYEVYVRNAQEMGFGSSLTSWPITLWASAGWRPSSRLRRRAGTSTARCFRFS